MKSIIAIFALLTSFTAHARSLEAVDCTRELISKALAERALNSTLEFLNSSDYYVENFQNSPDYDGYIVTVVTKSRVDQSTTTISYLAKIVNAKTCKVSVKMLAD